MTIGITPSMMKTHLQDSSPAFPLSYNLSADTERICGWLVAYLVYANSKEAAHARSKGVGGVE